MTDCDGAWVGWVTREVEGGTYDVGRCSGCGERWVVLEDRSSSGTGATEEEALRAALLDRRERLARRAAGAA
jgi:hypothetical protein